MPPQFKALPVNTKTCFVAELIIFTTPEGEDKGVCHEQLVLVCDHQQNRAVAAALALGHERTHRHVDRTGHSLVSEFLGISYLGQIEDDSRPHGTQLCFRQTSGVTREEAAARCLGPHELSAPASAVMRSETCLDVPDS